MLMGRAMHVDWVHAHGIVKMATITMYVHGTVRWQPSQSYFIEAAPDSGHQQTSFCAQMDRVCNVHRSCVYNIAGCRSVPRQKGFGDVGATSQSDSLVLEPYERFSLTSDFNIM